MDERGMLSVKDWQGTKEWVMEAMGPEADPPRGMRFMGYFASGGVDASAGWKGRE